LAASLIFGGTLCFAQRATVKVDADAGPPRDLRPFGKYLAEICTLTVRETVPDGEQKVSCDPTSRVVPDRKKAQTIDLKLVSDPAAKSDSPPGYPIVSGSHFFVSASADSGRAVAQRIISGNATPIGGSGTVRYRANAPGTIVIRANVNAGQPYEAAAPVDLILQVVADADKVAAAGCPVLGPAVATQSKPIDLPGVVSLLGNPTPFLLAAQGANTILIYSTREPLKREEQAILDSFQGKIDALVGRDAASLGLTPAPAKPFSVELIVPHGAALGDLATRISGLNYSQFTVQDVGSGAIRVTAPTTPDCDTWKGFLGDIRRMQWQLQSEPLMTKLFYLSSNDVATAFSGLGGAAAPSPSPGPAPSATAGAATPAAGGSTGGSTPAAASPGAPSSTPSSPSPAPAGGSSPAATPGGASPAPASSGGAGAPSNASISVTQPPGSVIQISSDTTPCVVAGLAFGNSSACSPAPSPAAGAAAAAAGSATPATPAAPPAPKPPPGMNWLAVSAGGGEQTPPDLLVFSDTNTGDDEQIAERKRILALLDLPRPEMIINAWVMQNSSSSGQAMGAFAGMVKDLVSEYNRALEEVVLTGWKDVKKQIATTSYFNRPFYHYVADRFIADTFVTAKSGQTPQQLSQAYLDRSQAWMADPAAPGKRTDLEICEKGRYCLGYNSLFRPLKPVLTDLLLTLIAADAPVSAAKRAIAAVEGTTPGITREASCANSSEDAAARCHSIWKNLGLRDEPPAPSVPSDLTYATCATQDQEGILGDLMSASDHQPRVRLRCFEQAIETYLGENEDPPYGDGLMRAAVADFLFNYKMSQQYPHEFVAYDLSQSADALNSALSPIIDAFNRDLTAFQIFVRADVEYRVQRINAGNDHRFFIKKMFGLDKPSFFNDGLITVRTISGQWTSAGATSQSFLNASTAPQLTALLNSVAGSGSASGGSTSGGSGSPLLGAVLSANPLSRAQLLAGALSNYQTTYAQIGRSMQLYAIPRSLSTASSAEIAITLNADESAAPTYLDTGGGTGNASINTSRVANHDTATRVRVESVKLFEVSSFSAIVQRSKSRFPLLPPFVEIPYVGTLLGIPLSAAKEFHSSTAVLSAVVVPTAADIAYGLKFVFDLQVDGEDGPCSYVKAASGLDVTKPCRFRRALSQKDLNQAPIRMFNKAMVRCLATSATACEKLTFAAVPLDY
jgi:hypothetical protein